MAASPRLQATRMPRKVFVTDPSAAIVFAVSLIGSVRACSPRLASVIVSSKICDCLHWKSMKQMCVWVWVLLSSADRAMQVCTRLRCIFMKVGGMKDKFDQDITPNRPGINGV